MERPPLLPPHDNVVHHPLGGASYCFRKGLIPYLIRRSPKPITVHLGSQPNSSPHLGNLTTFATAFAVASELRTAGRDVKVKFVYVETAPGESLSRDGIDYQRALDVSGGLATHRHVFDAVLTSFAEMAQVPFETDTQRWWRTRPLFGAVVQDIVTRRSELGWELSPDTGRLGLRAGCPTCGLADKHGVKNRYEGNVVWFVCPDHGEHKVDLQTSDVERLGFNTPLRNLIRVRLCSLDEERSWVMVTGGDYAGFYQEQLMWRLLDQRLTAPVILYAPVVVDWSGAKLSKSMYVREGAYTYLGAELRYLMEGGRLLQDRGLEPLFAEVHSWIKEPHKLFRSYSIELLNQQLLRRRKGLDQERLGGASVEGRG